MLQFRRIILGLILAGLFVSPGFVLADATPSPSAALSETPVVLAAVPTGGITVGGRIYNGGTRDGYSGVQIDTCGYGVATTDATGNWQLEVPAGKVYCARIFGGAPIGLAGPKITGLNSGLDAAQATSYENQVAGADCTQLTTCTADQHYWDGALDIGLDFVYGPGKVAAAQTSAGSTMPKSLFGLQIPSFSIPSIHIGQINFRPSDNMISVLVVGAAVLVMGIVLLFAPIRRKQKQTYDEYIRSKYYNF